jgi:hypothetical protein
MKRHGAAFVVVNRCALSKMESATTRALVVRFLFVGCAQAVPSPADSLSFERAVVEVPDVAKATLIEADFATK